MFRRIEFLGKPGLLSSILILTSLVVRVDAGQVATFELTPKSGMGGLTIFQADVQPAFSVVPSDPTASPLKVLDGSYGFNKQNMTVLLGDGDGVQQLVMLFGVEPSRDSDGKLAGFVPIRDAQGNPDPGLAADSKVRFSLDLDPDFKGVLSLLPTATTAQSFDLTALTLPPTSPSSPEPETPTPPTPPVVEIPTTQVPEPYSVAIWIAGMGFGTLRAIRFRQRRHLESAVV
jgi:hypothetical protein